MATRKLRVLFPRGYCGILYSTTTVVGEELGKLEPVAARSNHSHLTQVTHRRLA